MNDLFESLLYSYLKIVLPVAKAGAIATLLTLTIPSVVLADGIYMTNMKTKLTQSSINTLTDPARPPGVQPGDIVEYVLEAQVLNATGGPGVYFTTYVPSGVEVLGAWFVTDAAGTTVRPPGQGGQANDGFGARGSKMPFGNPFAGIGNSRQSDLYGDTGIFYSTDSRTQLFTADGSNIARGPIGDPTGTGTTSNGYNVTDTFYKQVDAFNLWDANQVNAFGTGGTLNTVPNNNSPTSSATIINSTGQGSTPFGSGSSVAGPNTGYTLDNTGNVGPWNRIQYQGSKIANTSDGPATAAGTPNTATLDDASSLGRTLSDVNPLPSATNAVRWSDGLRLLNEKVYVKIRVRINAAAIGSTSGTILNFEANGSDNWGSGSKDNPWRYFGPTVAQSGNLFVAKGIDRVNGVRYSGGNIPAGATITYKVRYLNLGNLPIKNVSLTDKLSSAIATTGCTASNPTLSSISNSVTVSNVTSGTSVCPAASATVTFNNLPNVSGGSLPALQGGEFTYDLKISSTAANGTVVSNNATFNGQDVVSSSAVTTTSASNATIGLQSLDYGDAPDTYGTDKTANNSNNTSDPVGASHIITTGLYLGATAPDTDANGFVDGTDNNGNATDDDTITSPGNGDDEDNFTLPTLTAGVTSYTIPASNITATNTIGQAATLHAWIDFNKNGKFDPTEYASVPVNSGTNNASPAGNLSWSGINVGAAGNTYARFRLTSDTAINNNTPGGAASSGEVEDYQIAIANPTQTINNTPSPTSCSVLGGTLSATNLFTPLNNGTFGVENGSPNQSPAINPYPGIVSGGNYRQFYDPNFQFGDYSYVANAVQPRNSFQHPGITDPVYGVTGRFFASDPNTSTPTLTATLTGLTPNQFYEYSFWAANSEPNGNPNNVDVLINGQKIYNTGPLTAFPAALEWKKHTVSFTNGSSTSITIDLKSTQTGSAGNDFYLDNIELRSCNFTVDYGDAPPSYGDAIHTTIPSTPKVYLGTVAPDGETSTPLGGNNGANADGDDINQSTDDEDAFTTLNDVLNTGTYTLNNIPVKNISGGDVTLHAWIDFNRDGKFAAGEYQSITVANNVTSANLSWTVPNGTIAGNTYARFRITPNALVADDVNTTDIDERSKNAVINGEVEDYKIAIKSAVSPLAGQLVINEVLYAQSGAISAAENDEFIELFNPSGNAINLSGFKLIDGNLLASATTDPNALDGTVGSITGSQSPYVFPNGTILQPGQYAVIWIGDQTPEHSATGAAFQAWLGKSAKLNNAGDDVWLYDADTKIIDYMAYGTGSAINTRPNLSLGLWNSADENKLDGAANGQSISLTPNGIDGNASACWEKTAIAANDPDSASTRCSNFLSTIDSDLAVINSNQRITSVGGNNNGKANLILVKRITNIFPNPNSINFNTVIDDGIANNEDNNPRWKNNYLLGQIKVTNVKPGDEVEYTIYFLSNGDVNAKNVKICDAIPDNMTFVSNSYATNFGMAVAFNATALPTTPNKNLSNAIGDDEGDFYPPGSNPAIANPCQKHNSIPNDPKTLIPLNSANNLAGVVLINLDTIPPATGSGTPANSYGLIRFRAKVK